MPVMSTDKISIIVPVYNMEKYVARCLDSLCRQTYENVEILCVDDGSTDGSAAILEAYKKQDRRICVFQQANGGLSVARNTGLQHAVGKYVMFCDSDDWFEPDMCQKMYTCMTDTQADAVVCNTIFEEETPHQPGESSRRVNKKYYNRDTSEMIKINRKNRFNINVMMFNKIFRRDIIVQNNIVFPKGCTHEDDAFWYMYSFYAKNVYMLACPLYHYLLRQNSIMGQYFSGTSKTYQDRIKISDVVCAFLKEKNLLNKHRKDMLLIYKCQLMHILPFFSDTEQQKMIKSVNANIKKNIPGNAQLLLSESRQNIVIAGPKDRIKMLLEWWGIKIIHVFVPGYQKQKAEKLSCYVRQIRGK